MELFRHLVERYQRPLLIFIHGLTRDPFLAEDIGQTVFLSFFQSLERFDEARETPVAAWLFTAARNLAINTMQKQRRNAPVEVDAEAWPDARPGPLDQLLRREEQAILAECLALLAEPYRTTLRASLQGRSLEEIAAREMVLPGTVKSRLARARQKIIALWRAEWER